MSPYERALANAYGIAVAGDMLVTSILVATVARGVWRWPMRRQRCAPIGGGRVRPSYRLVLSRPGGPVPSLRPELPLWQERIYAFMVRNAVSAPDYFLIAPQRVVELGTRVEI